MRVIITGGRDYDDAHTVDTVLRALDWEDVTLVHGGAPGADSLADQLWTGDKLESFPAEWGVHDDGCYHRPRSDGSCPAAGPRRNRQMLAAGADLVIAFPGGRGTADMVSIAREAGVPVLEVRP
jgi:hypothetical protein